MSVYSEANAFVRIVLLIIGLVLVVVAAVDFLEGFGLIYALVLLIVGLIFIAVSGRA
jgi:hypothetical protein